MFSARESVQNMGERLEGSWVSGNEVPTLEGEENSEDSMC